MVESHSTAFKSFVSYDEHHSFPLENIPFGAFINPHDNSKHCATRIGDFVVDLALLEQAGLFDGPHFTSLGRKDIFSHENLNAFIELGNDFWHEARVTLQGLFALDSTKLSEDLKAKALIPHLEV